MSAVELTYIYDKLEPLTKPRKTLAELQRDALLAELKIAADLLRQEGFIFTAAECEKTIAAVEAGKVPS